AVYLLRKLRLSQAARVVFRRAPVTCYAQTFQHPEGVLPRFVLHLDGQGHVDRWEPCSHLLEQARDSLCKVLHLPIERAATEGRREAATREIGIQRSGASGKMPDVVAGYHDCVEK